MQHLGIFTDNQTNKKELIRKLQNNEFSDIVNLKDISGKLFSQLAVRRFMEEEEKHGTKYISTKGQALKTMSSGEQKKALLFHILDQKPDYILLDNPFDNLDISFQNDLKTLLQEKASGTLLIQLASRKSDMLSNIRNFAKVIDGQLRILTEDIQGEEEEATIFMGSIPPAIEPIPFNGETLISFEKVSVSYGEKHVLKDIDWEVKTGEFWQLIGNNGTGKTTILSMITGDNPKAFGQEIYIFGNKKGSGESVWDIKEKIGYFSPAMTDSFSGRHSVENMLISGLLDSIGLYIKPTETQKRIIKDWLLLLSLWERRNVQFNDLSLGDQRLVMTVRAMVKHPPLLILDEPTSGMDDASASILVQLVNKIAQETQTTILFVSHRKEPGLNPKKILELKHTDKGSIGIVK
ncbi:ATP-binding cassette domain-containing protein [Maribacter aurantiacus]|uniref:ATP-binding cassette domain-containing protein n=1 Tax=Maribacter aurantiacus TaxID=1882343 RepID=A0A5R8M7Q6_9FLAO|nr:ATP-binding cassette domain-containing protein [Maribacter aurantiacus]TLF45601.1 ATP-binding cassette domain-containing protein [Maribacter aurantiacus]